MEASERVYHFSYIRAASCMAIIVLHTLASASILFREELTVTQNAVSMAITDCMMWAVPCFVMVTGALLLDEKKQITYQKLFGKYIARVLAALVVFSMIFRVFDMCMDAEKVSVDVFFDGLYKIFTGTSWSHMWYLYLLIGLYLLLPFYKKVAEHSSRKEIQYLLLIYVLFLSVLPLTQLGNVYSGFYIHVSTIYPFYLFCGYAVCHKILDVKPWAAAACTCISTAALALLTVIRWKYDIAAMEQLWFYSSILVILQAVGIFSLMVRTDQKVWCHKLLMKLDECSFGIYLVHMIFIRLILRYGGFNPYDHCAWVAFPAVIIVVLVLSYIVTWVLKKIPGFRKIV